jgi:hypothetical protein
LTFAVTVTATSPENPNQTCTKAANLTACDMQLLPGHWTLTPTQVSGYSITPPASNVYTVPPQPGYVQFQITVGGPTTFTIGGTVGGAATSGVTLTMSGCATGTTTSGSGGTYTLTGAVIGTCTVTPSFGSYTFSPANIPVPVSNTNVTGQNFTATAPAPVGPQPASVSVGHIGPH